MDQLRGLGLAAFLQQRRKRDGVNSERAARARLRFADGTRLEDSVDSGVVLFMTDAPVRLPVTVEILDGAGSMLTTCEAFEGN